MAAATMTPGQQTAVALVGILGPLVAGAVTGEVFEGSGPIIVQPTASGGVTAETSTVETFGLVAIAIVGVVLAVKFL